LKNESVLNERQNALPDNLRLRNGIYYAEFRVNGQRFRKSLGKVSLMLAKQRLKESIVAASAGDYDQGRAQELSVDEWATEYKKAHLATRVQRSAVEYH
jgi:hypothetical protein